MKKRLARFVIALALVAVASDIDTAGTSFMAWQRCLWSALVVTAFVIVRDD